MQFLLRRTRLAPIVAAALLAAPAAPARAGVIAGSSSAYGASFSLTFTPNPLIGGPPVTIGSGPIPAGVSGTAPAPYFVPGVALAFGVPPLSISALGALAASNVDGLPGPRFAHADASATTVSLGALPIPLLPPILTLTLADVSSSATVTGDQPGSLTATATTTLTGGVLAIPLLGIGPILLSVSPAPNTQVGLPAAGLSIVLNEQTFVGVLAPDFQSAFVEVNAVHVSFTGLPVPGPLGLSLGTLSGDLILAHSEARLAAVPEPGSLALAGVAVTSLAAWGWRRRRPETS